MLPNTLKGFTAYVNGVSYLGRLAEGTPPKIAIKTEEFRDGGMDSAYDLDVGLEKLELMLSFAEYDPNVYGQLGVTSSLTLRGSQEGEDGTVIAIVHTCYGLGRETDQGVWKPGSPSSAMLKLTQALRFYQLEIGGTEVIYIDIQNAIRRINGIDQLAARRAALGL